jgi:uroporphyrin-III C-methyltransferase
MQATGCVYLVGAGPGDPELLTMKAVRILKSADVVVYDRLVSPEILDLTPPGTTRISVGKQPAHHPVPQDEINDLLIRLAGNGRTVVRLKGGDPLIFGRGSEEALELMRHGVRFEIVPGITAAQGCAAASVVPLTHRGLATGVRYITGHCRQDSDLDFDWKGLADPDTTLVVYMGRANIERIANRLIEHGLAAETPVFVVCNGTTPREQRLATTLSALPQSLETTDFDGPILIMIGRVASLAGETGAIDASPDDLAAAALA